MSEFMVLVERAVRPVVAGPRRKLRMRKLGAPAEASIAINILAASAAARNGVAEGAPEGSRSTKWPGAGRRNRGVRSCYCSWSFSCLPRRRRRPEAR